jgi:dipeptidyl aminopeptidase/acylaminoacyl peptidase
MARDSRSVLDRPAPPPDLTVHYGAHPDHLADVWLPASAPADPDLAPPLVVMLHGGFWRSAYDRTHLRPFANALAGAGFVVATPEYRRTGAGGGWPATFDDVATAVREVPALIAQRAAVRLDRPVLAGHSAGGHLALWAGAGLVRDGAAPGGVVALAPVADLGLAHELDLDRGAVADLLGGGPAEQPERYVTADPMRLLPLGVRLIVVHGTRDTTVPIELSRRFVAAAQGAGDTVRLVSYDGGHFEVIDPGSMAWATVVASVAAAGRVDAPTDTG